MNDYFISEAYLNHECFTLTSIDLLKDACIRAIERHVTSPISPLFLLWTILRAEASSAFVALKLLTEFETLQNDVCNRIRKLPGGNAETALIDAVVLGETAQLARKLASEHCRKRVSSHHLLLALTLQANSEAGDALLMHRVTPCAVRSAINVLGGYPCPSCVLTKNDETLKYSILLKTSVTERLANVIADCKRRAIQRGVLGTIPCAMLIWSILRMDDLMGEWLMERCGVNIDSLARSIESILIPDNRSEPGLVLDLLNISKALESARKEALVLGNQWVGTEHLLLALSNWPESELPSILRAHGLEYNRLSEVVKGIKDEAWQ